MSTTAATPAATASPPRSWMGIDVAKQTFDAAIWMPGEAAEQRSARTLPKKSFPRTADGVAACLAWARSYVTEALGAVMEATGKYSTEIAQWFRAATRDVQPAIINPRLAKAFAESLSVNNRNDKVDARTLARYGAERQPSPFEPPTPEMEQLRDLVRYRQSLLEALTEEKNRAAEGAAAITVKRIRTRRIQQLERDIERIEKETRKALPKLPAVQADMEQLDSIYGVGWVTAVTVITELGDLRRFRRARQLTAFAGLAPTSHDSGTSVHRKSHTSKNGSTHVRRVLYLAAITAIRGDNDFAELYHRMVAAGKKPLVAIVAVMRKLLLVMRAILISGKPYNPHQRTATCG
jgi:transposase